MGYAVYEDFAASEWGVKRWAGYGVPAECDQSGCTKKIDRGLGYRCEEESCACGLSFCSNHLFDHPENVRPKPDTAEWVHHMLTDESWQQWREENPERVAALSVGEAE